MNARNNQPGWLAAMAAGVVALAVLPFVANDYLVGTGLSLLMWLALTQSWCVLSKMTGYISLGHVVFYGLGGYLMVVTWQQLPIGLVVVGAGILAAAFAALAARLFRALKFIPLILLNIAGSRRGR